MKNKSKYISSLILTLITVFAGVLLAAPRADAANTGKADAVVNVNDACGFDGEEGDLDYTFTFSPANGIADDTEGIARETTTGAGNMEVTLTCNNISGFEIQAIGYSPDASNPSGANGNTDMYSSTTSAVIPTGAGVTTATFSTSDPSFWGMKITSAVGSNGQTITSAYATAAHTFVAVPSSATTVIRYNGDTSPVTASMRADYGFYISQAQPAGTYTGKVKYTVVPD